MSFLRPEIRAALHRWREALIGAAMVAAGLLLVVTEGGLWRWLGLLLALAGAAILREGVRRSRRLPDGQGPGMVEVDERRITYLSARGGGSISIDALAEVDIVTLDHAAFWALSDREGTALSIPASASGAAQIYDALSPLPGYSPDRALAAARAGRPGRVTIWRHPAAPVPRRLH
ncbi:hypothetical protein OCGS_2052 [Oceaniovalibus guishaninsula JLT2003]|uniref:Uncharacterized protein n=1 Tax=Oceaniovalibus guishaninsula JLT2003 TaxID=1231392 RepID=K2H7X0_9RHOB|nr:hypothetical protein [Oceaniovalibus guishaninsula]EKE43718.1 hypothetical protein OCGS_2052 [Oceaniovalibus guishaninsula JLT2003]